MTTMDMLMDTITPVGPLPELRVSDTIQPKDPLFVYPITEAHGKSTIKSLMCPQDMAQGLLPHDLFLQLQEFCYKGCPAQCGPNWTPEVIKAAMAAGPHISALIPENTKLIWEDIKFQVNVGFVRIISVSDLFGKNQPPGLKISRVAVVPQDNRRGWITLNLSAEVADPKFANSQKAPRSKQAVNPEPGKLTKSTHCTLPLHPSVNETTVQAGGPVHSRSTGPGTPLNPQVHV
jgi:hypothetical protein